MDWWPLLDIPKAIADADRALADIAYYVECLHAETEGCYPDPADATTLVANVAAIRELLTLIIPPTLQATITEEQRQYDEECDRWEPTNY
jgi:hypothetical protein